MLRGKKPPEETVQPSNRTRLPLESGIRPVNGIKEFQAMAEATRGHQFELEWTTGTPGQSFVLDVQWDTSSDDPFWSLYEENDTGSKKLWSQTFKAADIEMMYDVLVMSCGAVTHTQNLSEILKPKPGQEDDSKYSSSPSSKKPETKESFSLNINAATAAEPNSPTNHIPVAELPTPAVNPSPAAPPTPTPAAPPVPAPPATPNQPAGFPPGGYPPYNMPGGMPGFAVPFAPVMPPPAGYMPPPVVPPPGWTFAPINPDNPYAQPQMIPANRQSSEPLSTLPIDVSLVNKRYVIALADLLRDADLINKASLEAALKIQELVQEGRLPAEDAVKTLKQHHQKGEAIEKHIDSVKATSSSVPQTSGKAQSLTKEKQAAFDLLEKAALLSKDDITTAKNVSRKHGGDLVSILKAAQKLDDNTFSAALICAALMTDDSMKLEQCVITLNYCSRSRVDFDEAMTDLNFPNPRKK